VSDEEFDGSAPRPAGDRARSAGGRHRRSNAPSKPAPGEGPVQRPVRGGRSRLTSVTRVLALLCLPAAAAAGVFWIQKPTVRLPTSLLSGTTQSAMAAAKSSVQTILSYDYRSIGADIARARADTTGVFEQQYTGTASQLLSEAKQVKAIVQATIGSSGVVSAARNEVVVLLFVDQASVRQLTGQKAPTTRIDQSRVQATMTRVQGRWLVSALAAL